MFEKTFCSSPWFHVRLTYDGSLEPCRWAKNPERIFNLNTTTILDYYNSDQMKTLRSKLLLGDKPEVCYNCYYEESFGKLNGRLRQLLKSGIQIDNFDLTLRSSPHFDNFKFSNNNEGLANLSPVDLQIELGNTCNSACIMCSPEASSKLATEYQKLNLINSKLFNKPNSYNPWTKNKELVNRLVNELINIPNLRYIHFLGGETLYEESFYTICEQLIEHDLAKNIIIGTTTNGTIFNDRIKRFIKHFKQFHLGISIESVTKLNDYIRWPGVIESILDNINKFLELRKIQPELYISLRITPNIFSILEIDKLFIYMIENNVIAESCNILNEPKCLRIELLPENLRILVQEKLRSIIETYYLQKNKIVNIRRTDQIPQVIADVILDYYNFICNYESPDNVEQLRYDLVDYIKAFESLRGNSILDYAPAYEEFLRNYGY